MVSTNLETARQEGGVLRTRIGRAVDRFVNGPRWAYLFILPSFLLVAIVVVYPMVAGLLLSVQNFKLNQIVGQGDFVGLKNFARLAADPVAAKAAVTTLVYVGFVVVGALLVGLLAALLLFRSFRGAWIFRLLVLLPLFMPSVVSSYIWWLLMDSRAGVVNDVLLRLGIIQTAQAWFSNPTTALIAVIVIEIWSRYAFFAIFILAGLYTISDDQLEAAAVDGAGSWARFRGITLPLLAPVIVVASVLVTISVTQSPDTLVILTQGGPARATTTLSLYAFQTAYLTFDYGYAGAIGVVLLAALSIFAIVYVKISGVLRNG